MKIERNGPTFLALDIRLSNKVPMYTIVVLAITRDRSGGGGDLNFKN